MLPCADKSNELQNHDQRSGRCLGEPEPVHHLTRFKPAVMKESLLRDVWEHGVGTARRGDRMRLGKPRFSEDTFRFVKLRVTEAYRDRVEEMKGWCDERRSSSIR